MQLPTLFCDRAVKIMDSTPHCSRVVPHPSTAVHYGCYGRIHTLLVESCSRHRGTVNEVCRKLKFAWSSDQKKKCKLGERSNMSTACPRQILVVFRSIFFGETSVLMQQSRHLWGINSELRLEHSKLALKREHFRVHKNLPWNLAWQGHIHRDHIFANVCLGIKKNLWYSRSIIANFVSDIWLKRKKILPKSDSNSQPTG